MANPALLALFASGRQEGVVLDCGHDLSHVVPVYQGSYTFLRRNIFYALIYYVNSQELLLTVASRD